MQPLINATTVDQVGMRADFRNAALIHDDDFVRAANSGNAVCNHDDRPARHQVGERALHQHFRLSVQM